MSLSSWLSSIGLALNAVGAFIMLRWPFAVTLICFDPEDKKWKKGGNFVSGIPVPGWKVFTARLGPILLFLGFLPQIVACWLNH